MEHLPGDDLSSLDVAFELSEKVEDPKFRALYEVLVARMRQEARHLPMNTVQQLLIERIASNYIYMRLRERGDLGGFPSSAAHKDFNYFWLSMTQEFNRLLGKSDGSAADRRALLKEMQDIIVKTVNTLNDPKVRAEMLGKFAGAFEAAGI
jgi:hypothetical protein